MTTTIKPTMPMIDILLIITKATQIVMRKHHYKQLAKLDGAIYIQSKLRITLSC